MLFPIILDVITITKPWDHSIEVPITSEVITLEVREEVNVETIEEMIIRYAKENWVDQTLALNIARCESWFNPDAKNKNSTAWWLYQHLVRYRDGRAKKYDRPWASIWDGEAQAEVSVKMLKYEWTNPWIQSLDCRNK